MATKSSASDLVFSPAQIARIGTEYIRSQRGQQRAGVPIGLASIDKDMNPMKPGDLVSIIARPGNGKTSFMLRHARWRARQLQANGEYNRVCIYVTYEQHVEDLHTFHVASEIGLSVSKMDRGEISDEFMGLIETNAVNRPSVPLWFIGHSQERRKQRPGMKIDDLRAAFDSIEHWSEDGKDHQIDMIYIDYLQRIPLSSGKDKIEGTEANVNACKDIGLEFGCPVMLGVQARREVDAYAIPVPSMGDGQWSSGVEQASDKIFCLVRPITYKKTGDTFGKTIVNGNHQMLVLLAKQKKGVANIPYWTMFAPEYNQFEEAEVSDLASQMD